MYVCMYLWMCARMYVFVCMTDHLPQGQQLNMCQKNKIYFTLIQNLLKNRIYSTNMQWEISVFSQRTSNPPPTRATHPRYPRPLSAVKDTFSAFSAHKLITSYVNKYYYLWLKDILDMCPLFVMTAGIVVFPKLQNDAHNAHCRSNKMHNQNILKCILWIKDRNQNFLKSSESFLGNDY